MDKPDTVPKRPMPRRPRYGWQAWESTIGYMNNYHSPDIVLKLVVCPAGDESVHWSAILSWGERNAAVKEKNTLAAALRELWLSVKRDYTVFEQDEAAIRQPLNYKDDEWFDERTSELLQRLVQVNRSVFGTDWQVLIIYQPVENPDIRVQARLLAQDKMVQVGGNGATVQDACHRLYTNAAPIYTRLKK